MYNQEVELLGITKTDIQEIFEQALKDFKEAKTRIIYLDASYLYTFHLDDFQYIKKLNLLVRRDPLLVREWHKLLERWYNDQTVRNDNGYIIKPIAISRSFDRVVNEGLEMMAGFVTGSGSPSVFDCRGIGDADIDEASPADLTLGNLVDMINVNETPNGGSLSRDGTTIYSIGNHDKAIATPANSVFTECGMFDDIDETIARILDHSAFENPIPHTQNADAPGSTTVIYMCSG
jgi:hypothetical protein